MITIRRTRSLPANQAQLLAALKAKLWRRVLHTIRRMERVEAVLRART